MIGLSFFLSERSYQDFPTQTLKPLPHGEWGKAYLGTQCGNMLLPSGVGMVPIVLSQNGGQGLKETGGAGPISSSSFVSEDTVSISIKSLFPGPVMLSKSYQWWVTLEDRLWQRRMSHLKEQDGNVWNNLSRSWRNLFPQVVLVIHGKCRVTCMGMYVPRYFNEHTFPFASSKWGRVTMNWALKISSTLSMHCQWHFYFKIRKLRFGGIK